MAETMELKDILHVTVRTMDLDATNRFYGEVLGMRLDHDRPPTIPAAGTWFDTGRASQFHIIATEKAYGKVRTDTEGGGNVDHIALRAVGYDAWKARILKHGLDYRENIVKSLGQWQLFIRDPSGIVVELQFIIADEPPGAKGPDGNKPYGFGQF